MFQCSKQIACYLTTSQVVRLSLSAVRRVDEEFDRTSLEVLASSHSRPKPSHDGEEEFMLFAEILV
jgi:hypothetical protein